MRRGDHGPRAFQAPVDVHASADGQVYLFKRRPNESQASSDNDDEELGVMEMRPRMHQCQEQGRLKNIQLLERKVLHDDNLSKLALQYGCKVRSFQGPLSFPRFPQVLTLASSFQVADIKRVNNLMQEQDLFALKSVKIPVGKHRIVTETDAEMSDPKEELPRSSTDASPQDTSRAHRHLQEVPDFLMEVDHDMEKLIQTTNDQDEGILEYAEKGRKFGYRGAHQRGHGADCGIKWWNAVVAMLLIGIILPLFCVIYFKMKNNQGVSSTGSGTILSTSSSNTSETVLGAKGVGRFQEPG